MTVSELIEILEEMDPEAEVLVMSQQSWPFENTLAGVCQRKDLIDEGELDEPEGEDSPRDTGGDELPASDVFLIEGRQLRYGSKSAWDVARRW